MYICTVCMPTQYIRIVHAECSWDRMRGGNCNTVTLYCDKIQTHCMYTYFNVEYVDKY